MIYHILLTPSRPPETPKTYKPQEIHEISCDTGAPESVVRVALYELGYREPGQETPQPASTEFAYAVTLWLTEKLRNPEAFYWFHHLPKSFLRVLRGHSIDAVIPRDFPLHKYPVITRFLTQHQVYIWLRAQLSTPLGSNIHTQVTTNDIHLKSEDILLVNHWLSHFANNNEEQRWRLETARKAEIKARDYLACTYRVPITDIIDTSQTVLRHPSCTKWATHDLEYKGNCFDVKSGIRRKKGKHAELLIKQWKTADRNTAIHYIGTICEANGADFRIIGTATQQDFENLEKVAAIFSIEGGIRAQGILSCGNRFFPEWFFDSPREHAKTCDYAVSILSVIDFSADLAAYFLLFAPNLIPESLPRTPQNIIVGKILAALQALQTKRLRRAELMIALLSGTIEALPLRKECSILNSWGIISISDLPIWSSDSGNVLREWCCILDTLWNVPESLIGNITDICFSQERVLTGVVNGNRRTIIAYCGSCGKFPLIAGVNNWCEICGHLICDATDNRGDPCSYCKTGCSRVRIS